MDVLSGVALIGLSLLFLVAGWLVPLLRAFGALRPENRLMRVPGWAFLLLVVPLALLGAVGLYGVLLGLAVLAGD